MNSTKYVVVFALLVTVLLQVPLVASANPSRYSDITWEDTVIAQFDTQTLKYVKDPYRDELLLDIWIKSTDADGKSYSLNHYLFRLNKREMMPLDLIDFNNNGQIVNKTSYAYDPTSWSLVIPETSAEKWYQFAIDYATKNDPKLRSEFKDKKGALK